MVNYANGKVYKLVCTLPGIDDIYVGGTAYPRLSQRMCCHRSEAKATKWNYKLYRFMRQHGIENFKIELLENCPCTSKKELRLREQHFIDLLRPTLNSTNATSNRKEVLRRYNNKPERKARMKRYYQENKHKWDKYKRTRDRKVANVGLISRENDTVHPRALV